MENVSRRVVLGGGIGTAALIMLGVDAASANAASAKAATIPAAPLRRHYTGSVGKAFTATHGGHTHHLTLTAIRDAVPALTKDKPYCFTLIFERAHGPRLPDAIYQLKRRGVPTQSLLLSSFGQSGGLQVAINRPIR